MDDADTIAELWVDLASDQRAHGSHLAAGSNRSVIRSALSRRIVTDDVRVAREADRLLGFVMFSPETGSFEKTTPRGLIENIYVVPDRRGEGIGSALLDSAERALASEGVEAIALDVLAGNDDARAFYRRHGYAPHRIAVEKSIETDTHSKGDD